MYSRSNYFALHNNVLLYIMLLCKGEHLTESRNPTNISFHILPKTLDGRFALKIIGHGFENFRQTWDITGPGHNLI